MHPPRSRMAARLCGAMAGLVSCLLVVWLVSGCQRGAQQSAEVADSHATDAGKEAVEQQPEEDEDKAIPPDLEDRTMTIAQFRERVKATTSDDEKVELLGASGRVVKDKLSLARFLVEMLQTGGSADVRMAAADELSAELVGGHEDEIVAALSRALDPAREPESDVRRGIGLALMDFHTPAAYEALKRMLHDPDPEVALGAARSMARSMAKEGPSGWARLIDMLGQPAGDASALASLELRDQGPRVVDTLIRELGRSQRPRQRAAIAACLGMICSGNTPTQLEFAKATKATSRIAHIESVPDPRAVEPLIAALADPSADVREAAAQALGLIGDRRATPPLAKALKDPDRHVRKRAACALMLPPPSLEGFLALCDAAVNDPYPETRRYAVQALGWYKDPGAVKTLTEALGDQESSEVREAAARYLGGLGDDRAVPMLVSRFTDPDVGVRWAAVRSVGQLGGKQAELALTRLLESGKQEPQVMHAATEALRRLGGTLPLSEEAKRLFEPKKQG